MIILQIILSMGFFAYFFRLNYIDSRACAKGNCRSFRDQYIDLDSIKTVFVSPSDWQRYTRSQAAGRVMIQHGGEDFHGMAVAART